MPIETPSPSNLTPQVILAEFAPAAALVDGVGHVESVSGPAGRYLELTTGEPSGDLPAMVRDELRGVLQTVLAQVTPGGPPLPPVTAWVRRDDGEHPVRVSVCPIPAQLSPKPYFLVVFEEAAANVPAAPVPATESLVQHLEQELRAAREALQANAVANQRDQTERKRMEAELQDRSDRAAILSTAVDPILTIDGRGVIESLNSATERTFGWSAAELIGQNVSILMPPETRPHHQTYLANYLATGVKKVIGIGREVTCLRRDGSTFPADLSVGQVDHLPRFVGIVRDVTERKRLEREVLEIAAAEQERIGRELHDSVGQGLTGIRLMAEALVDGLREQHSKELALAVRITDALREALGQVRTLSRGLVAAEVDAAGLAPALEALASRIRETSAVDCTFERTANVRFADAAVATHLLRIAQEAVANALRHAIAKRITITLTDTGKATELHVRDDGCGFALPTAESRGGLGLKLMRYRAGLLGTTLHVHTGASGTVVSCSLPQEPGHEP